MKYYWPEQSVSRVLFLSQVTLASGGDHSSRTAVTDGLKRPTRKHGRAALDASLLGLAPGGVYLASDVTAGPGELLPHPFTLTCHSLRSGRRTSLCGTFPGVTPAGRYPAPCPVEPGLSSPITGSGHLFCFGQTMKNRFTPGAAPGSSGNGGT